MSRAGLRTGFILAILLVLGACAKKTDHAAPIAFVPADTPYVMANLESLPDPVIERWRQQMQGVWPLLAQHYGPLIADAASKDEPTARVLRAMFDELRERDTPEKWQQIGFGAHARGAVYGIGLLPVIRIELSDSEAFRAMVARVEQNGGAKLAVARVGEQDVWTFGPESVQGLMAIVDKHLVLGVAPTNADEALKRRILGLDRPQKSLADTGALLDFNKVRGYLPYGSGWIDTRRIVALVGNDPAVASAARAAGTEPPKFDAVCQSEFDALAAKAPVLAFGYTALASDHWSMHARLDLAPALAKSLAALPGTLPAPTAGGLFDLGIALPVLRGRDLLVGQLDAMAKTPFACSTLAPLNKELAETKAKLDQMIPPPFADLVGVRLSVSRFAWPTDASLPDLSGSLLIGSTNPAFISNLARLSLPALAQINLEPNGQPVPIPASVVPNAPAGLVLHAAMSPHVLGLSVGADETTRLAAAVTTAPGPPGLMFDLDFSGEVYRLLADGIGRFATPAPGEPSGQMDVSRDLYALYAQWFKRTKRTVAFTNDGIEFVESVDLEP